MATYIIIGTGLLAYGLYNKMSQPKKWYYLNDKDKWIHFSVPENEKILEDAFVAGKSQVTYAYPLGSDIKFTAYFKSIREDWLYWNEDKQTGKYTKLKRT